MPAQPAMNLADTIVAVSSPAGAAERAIVRLSGDEAVAIADRVFDPSAGRHGHPPLGGHDESASGHGHAGVAMPPTCIAELPTYSACDGRIALPADHMDVPATVYLMRGPRSYTREDVVELHVGGWPAVVPLVVEALVSAGARPAEPGEFTFRALVHGRLDLAQAEAVMAVIDAGSRAALRAAGDLLAGDLSREVAALAARVREALALVEVDLDFSDQDVPPIPPERIAADLAAVRDDLAALGRRSRAMETFSGEARLVLAGWPNAGKSSLFNRLLARDRAIVTDVPGTTRDEVRATLHRGGLALRLSDVAGLDVARDELAGLARAKALEVIGRADLVVLVLDATAESYERTDDLLALVAAPVVVAVAKCDLASPDRARAWVTARGLDAEVVATSAATGQGVDALGEALVRAVTGGTVDRQAAGPALTARHRSALEGAAVALARAHRQARRAEPAGELVALELNDALDALAAITGEGAGAGVLETIFARFCIGK